MKRSWRTTLLGILALVAALSTNAVALLDGDPDTTFNWESIAIALTGLGLLAAKDHKEGVGDDTIQ
ncbi:MAG: hypothetical protein DHS20C16_03410 [Phycisphaerae bacterium]|nr:MAG: hypothetical protein DHS20C16_03410 [Phycisphaerae bacterium]